MFFGSGSRNVLNSCKVVPLSEIKNLHKHDVHDD